MTSYSFGDILLVPFPFTDQSDSKKRPAVVVSSTAYQRERPDVILMAVTSQIRPSTGLGESLVTHWKDAGLLKPSLLKPILFTLERTLVLRRLGTLRGEDLISLRETLGVILGDGRG
ncbi:MAG TPA: type II toxin-antitoxin system PemK/MazF family toxin [Thermoanaerobaculia bacterium]|nr:type II toxin-antitoxin system PemK/MazF family toxin [Thermoanaerobaculia bacterium]